MDHLWAIYALTLLFANISTGGGGAVEGDAKPGRDFVGHDSDHSITFNAYLDQKKQGAPPDVGSLPGTQKDVIEWHQVAIFGSEQLGVVGLRDQTKELDDRLTRQVADLRSEVFLGRIIVLGLGLIVFTLVIIVAKLLLQSA